MLGKEHFTGTPRDFLDQYPAHTRVGKLARKHDAKSMLQAIQELEQEVIKREAMSKQIHDRLERMTAEHHLNMDYLFTFGVRCQHRNELVQILQEATEHGGLSLQEAAALANARAAQQEVASPDNYNVNGLSGASFSN